MPHFILMSFQNMSILLKTESRCTYLWYTGHFVNPLPPFPLNAHLFFSYNIWLNLTLSSRSRILHLWCTIKVIINHSREYEQRYKIWEQIKNKCKCLPIMSNPPPPPQHHNMYIHILYNILTYLMVVEKKACWEKKKILILLKYFCLFQRFRAQIH